MGGGPDDDVKPAGAPQKGAGPAPPPADPPDPGARGGPGKPRAPSVPEGDDTTTVEAGPPAAPPALPSEADVDDRTAQPQLAPVSSTRRPPPPLPSRASARPALGALTDVTEDLEDEDDDEEEDDSITTMAPRLPAGLVLPGSVEIRTVEQDDEADDETEVRTIPGSLPESLDPPTDVTPATSKRFVPSPRPAAGVPASAAILAIAAATERHDDEDDENATTQAHMLVLGKENEIDTRRVVVPPDEDESITTRAPLGEVYDEDSVTSRGPVVSGSRVAEVLANAKPAEPRPSLVDTVEGPTKKLRRRDAIPGAAPSTAPPPAATSASVPAAASGSRPAVAPASSGSGADSEPDSITTQAPAPLTNMLRVIAADDERAVPRLGDDPHDMGEDDTQLGGHTAVMPGAPLKRIAEQVLAGHHHAAAAAAAAAAGVGPASLGATLASNGSSSPPGVAPREGASVVSYEGGFRVTRPQVPEVRAPGPQGATFAGPDAMTPPHALPGLHASHPPAQHLGSLAPAVATPPPRAPSYGLLVAAVAAVCLLVPFALFVMLKADSDGPSPVPPSAAQGDPTASGRRAPAPPVVPTPSSALLSATAPGGSSSAAPSSSVHGAASGSAKGGAKAPPVRR